MNCPSPETQFLAFLPFVPREARHKLENFKTQRVKAARSAAFTLWVSRKGSQRETFWGDGFKLNRNDVGNQNC